ncbi:hypothetical protein F5888DRAFT_1859611 [Russula emetica]|nr:hypothetical protein F5888DRAFT_1859611 [Russula emetica]
MSSRPSRPSSTQRSSTQRSSTQRSSTPTPTEEQSDPPVDFGHELKSAVDTMLQAYPNFRILILGRSGVGKSNLINAIFKTDFAIVEHGRKAGVSNIEREIKSLRNPRLILHDSQGFCHGSGDNFNIVKNFIETRSQKEDLKDRLHAIWLCSAVPTYGGSLLEVGEEEILQMMKGCGVPIVAVFTKYDVLVESLKPIDEEEFYGDIEKEIENLGKEPGPDTDLNTGTSAPIDPHVLSLAEKKVGEMITPFEGKLGVPWVKVSVKHEFSDTLDELVDVTQQRIHSSLELLWVITQQQSVVPKIKASIAFGKKIQGYWLGLSTSFKLASGGKSLEKWFKVIHRDIVTIWGIYDPKEVFTSAAKDMSELQQDLVDVEGGTVLRNMYDIQYDSWYLCWNLTRRVGAIPAVAAGLSAVVPPAAPFALPIAAGLVFATWVYNVASVTPNVLRGMMGYIVDFTIVMQSLFFLMQARTEAIEASGSHSPAAVNERLFKVALDAYKQDVEHSLQKVHGEIRSFVTMKKAIFKSEMVIKEVENLINVHRFKPSERFMALARTNTPN